MKLLQAATTHLLLVVPLFTAAGCSPSAEPPPVAGFIERDSAGIRIVENSNPAWSDGEGWRIGDVLTSVGRAEGDPNYLLYRVFDGTRLSDGTVVVANSGTSELRFFDSDGQFVRTVGRTGGGPGEFQSENTIRALVRMPGDSLLTFDIYGQKLSRWAPNGDFVEASRLAISGRMYFWKGVFSDGTLLLALNNPAQPDIVDGSYPRRVRLVRFSASGDSIRVLMDYDEGSWHAKVQGERVMLTEPPFARQATSRAVGDRVCLALGEANEYTLFDQTGAPILISRRRTPPVPVTEEDRVRHLEDKLRSVPEERRALIRRAGEDLPFPEVFPPYKQMFVDSEQNVWLEEYTVGEEAPNEWSVFDPGGRWLGEVLLPEGLSIYEIGPDYVMGETEDDLGIERVVVYGLIKDS